MASEDAPPQRERCRLYLITPPVITDVEAFTVQMLSALDSGDVACLQIRQKHGVETDVDATRAVATAVMGPAQGSGVAVIINDSVDLALELGADGVHVGRDDTPVEEARRRLGPDAIIGATCKSSRHLAMQAGEAGADYVAFGAFFPSPTKTETTPADLDVLNFWQSAMTLPCVAIGGLTVANARPIIEAGADFLAVSAGVWAYQEGPAAAVESFNALFDAVHKDAPYPTTS
ncbi:MAG: thiamine phosphate synthase [Pseudomonadota bacterium]